MTNRNTGEYADDLIVQNGTDGAQLNITDSSKNDDGEVVESSDTERSEPLVAIDVIELLMDDITKADVKYLALRKENDKNDYVRSIIEGLVDIYTYNKESIEKGGFEYGFVFHVKSGESYEKGDGDHYISLYYDAEGKRWIITDTLTSDESLLSHLKEKLDSSEVKNQFKETFNIEWNTVELISEAYINGQNDCSINALANSIMIPKLCKKARLEGKEPTIEFLQEEIKKYKPTEEIVVTIRNALQDFENYKSMEDTLRSSIDELKLKEDQLASMEDTLRSSIDELESIVGELSKSLEKINWKDVKKIHDNARSGNFTELTKGVEKITPPIEETRQLVERRDQHATETRQLAEKTIQLKEQIKQLKLVRKEHALVSKELRERSEKSRKMSQQSFSHYVLGSTEENTKIEKLFSDLNEIKKVAEGNKELLEMHGSLLIKLQDLDAYFHENQQRIMNNEDSKAEYEARFLQYKKGVDEILKAVKQKTGTNQTPGFPKKVAFGKNTVHELDSHSLSSADSGVESGTHEDNSSTKTSEYIKKENAKIDKLHAKIDKLLLALELKENIGGTIEEDKKKALVDEHKRLSNKLNELREHLNNKNQEVVERVDLTGIYDDTFSKCQGACEKLVRDFSLELLNELIVVSNADDDNQSTTPMDPDTPPPHYEEVHIQTGQPYNKTTLPQYQTPSAPTYTPAEEQTYVNNVSQEKDRTESPISSVKSIELNKSSRGDNLVLLNKKEDARVQELRNVIENNRFIDSPDTKFYAKNDSNSSSSLSSDIIIKAKIGEDLFNAIDKMIDKYGEDKVVMSEELKLKYEDHKKNDNIVEVKISADNGKGTWAKRCEDDRKKAQETTEYTRC